VIAGIISGTCCFSALRNVVWYTARNSWLVEYNRISNGMRLIKDAGDNWLGPVSGAPLGTPNSVLSNAHRRVNVAAATAIRERVDDWWSTCTPAPGPAITPVTNTSNGGNNETFTIQSNHAGGVSQLSAVHLRIGPRSWRPE
jgi:hypothetical protein